MSLFCKSGSSVKTMREPVEKVANYYRGEPGVKVNSNPDGVYVDDDDDGDEDWKNGGWF